MRFWDLRKRGIAVSNNERALPTSADAEKIRLSPVDRALLESLNEGSGKETSA